jgi:hypothetical protein
MVDVCCIKEITVAMGHGACSAIGLEAGHVPGAAVVIKSGVGKTGV